MFKNEKGITLVALVVTIIVLIILAVISISVALSDDGIVSRAESAEQHQLNADKQFEQFELNTVKYIDDKIDAAQGRS